MISFLCAVQGDNVLQIVFSFFLTGCQDLFGTFPKVVEIVKEKKGHFRKHFNLVYGCARTRRIVCVCVVKHCSKNNAFMLINLAFFFNGTFASKQINPELTRVFGNRWSES